VGDSRTSGDPARPRVLRGRGALRRDSVKKNVAAIHISGKLSLLQRKLSNVLLLNAYDGLLSQRSHRIDARALCMLIGYNSNDMDTLKDALRALVETTAEWDVLGDDDGQEWGVSALLASARLRGGTCEYAYSPALAEKLHDPKIFALINLSIQREFSSGHAFALYENCYRFVRTGSTGWWDIDMFRRLMGVEESVYYRTFKHLNAKVVKPAVSEVNAVSNIRLVVELRREGRAVAAIRFLIREQARERLAAGAGAPCPDRLPIDQRSQGGAVSPCAAAEDSAECDAADAVTRARLLALGVAERLARQWIADHGAAYVAEKLNYVAEQSQRGRVRGSAVGYLSAALRDDYRAPSGASGFGRVAHGAGGSAHGLHKREESAPLDAGRAPQPGRRAMARSQGDDARARLAALKRSHRAACFDAVEALVSRRNPTQRDADRRQFLGRIASDVDREDFRLRSWRSSVNASAIFAFWDAIFPGALPSLAEVAARLGVDLAAIMRAAEGADESADGAFPVGRVDTADESALPGDSTRY